MVLPGERMVSRPDGLTARQREIADFVDQVCRKEGRPPSRADIARRFGFNRATAQQHLVALERHGALRRVPGARGLAMSTIQSKTPILGRVPAGGPLEPIEDHNEDVMVPAGMFRQQPDMLLRVVGDSMTGAGIFEGDLVAVVLESNASSGDIVVARVDQEVTIKRLRVVGSIVELVPENNAYNPIRIVGNADFAIEGVVVGVIRRF